MSVVLIDRVGGEWNEDGTPTERSLNQEPLPRRNRKMKKQKAYCGQCIHYSRKGSDDRCAKVVTITVSNSASYMHPDTVRKEYCWEKNAKNKCSDFIEMAKVYR